MGALNRFSGTRWSAGDQVGDALVVGGSSSALTATPKEDGSHEELGSVALKEAFHEFIGSAGPSDRVGYHDGVRIRRRPEERADVDHTRGEVRVEDHVVGKIGVDHLPWMIDRGEFRDE